MFFQSDNDVVTLSSQGQTAENPAVCL